ncbi:hypothetical protein Ancab_012417, partial [Ancistrocladus abbreviatus]
TNDVIAFGDHCTHRCNQQQKQKIFAIDFFTFPLGGGGGKSFGFLSFFMPASVKLLLLALCQ